RPRVPRGPVPARRGRRRRGPARRPRPRLAGRARRRPGRTAHVRDGRHGPGLPAGDRASSPRGPGARARRGGRRVPGGREPGAGPRRRAGHVGGVPRDALPHPRDDPGPRCPPVDRGPLTTTFLGVEHGVAVVIRVITTATPCSAAGAVSGSGDPRRGGTRPPRGRRTGPSSRAARTTRPRTPARR